eukprot:TRINITY_DN65_c0_g1_i3.p2 TRINITY_DN65_c0_g1~~TRINITY_DN65_c0_g1_i3.p2  ORF type:complete len:2560 (+),score=236.88 TRINITY_DN65_c0_g1_i3:12267-19946(+)
MSVDETIKSGDYFIQMTTVATETQPNQRVATYQVSGNVFTLSACAIQINLPLPIINTTSPVLCYKDTFLIRWNFTGPEKTPVSLNLVQDNANGSSSIVVANLGGQNVPITQYSLAWNSSLMTSIPNGEYRIQIVQTRISTDKDTSLQTVVGVSGLFSFYNCQVNLGGGPIGGQVLCANNKEVINWSSVGLTGTVSINLIGASPVTSILIVENLPIAQSSYIWSIPAGLPNNTYSYQVVFNQIDATKVGYSSMSNSFSIIQCGLTVSSPISNNTYCRSDDLTVSWMTTKSVSGPVQIDLLNAETGSVVQNILSTSAGIQVTQYAYQFSLNNSTLKAPDGIYRISVKAPMSQNNALLTDVTGVSGLFYLYPCSLNFTFPLVNSLLCLGDVMNVTWDNSHITGNNLTLHLMNDNHTQLYAASWTFPPQATYFEWNVTSLQPNNYMLLPGSTYRFMIEQDNDEDLDKFNIQSIGSYFTVNSCSLKMNTTQEALGGTFLCSGDQQIIRWSSAGLQGNISLDIVLATPATNSSFNPISGNHTVVYPLVSNLPVTATYYNFTLPAKIASVEIYYQVLLSVKLSSGSINRAVRLDTTPMFMIRNCSLTIDSPSTLAPLLAPPAVPPTTPSTGINITIPLVSSICYQDIMLIQWRAVGSVGDYVINLVDQNNQFVSQLFVGSDITVGAFSWLVTPKPDIPTTSGTPYKIQIRSHPNDLTKAVVEAYSSGVFFIKNCSLSIDIPTLFNGQLCLQNIKAITWVSTGLIGNVSLELVSMATTGQVYVVASDIDVSLGVYLWNSMSVPVGNYTLQIVNHVAASSNVTVSNSSKAHIAATAEFSISSCALTSKTPVSNALLCKGDTHVMSWDLLGITGSILIELLGTNGTAISADITGLPSVALALNNSYTWNVPYGLTNGEYRFRYTFIQSLAANVSLSLGNLGSISIGANLTTGIKLETLSESFVVTFCRLVIDGNEVNLCSKDVNTIKWQFEGLSNDFLVNVFLVDTQTLVPVITVGQNIPITQGTLQWSPNSLSVGVNGSSLNAFVQVVPPVNIFGKVCVQATYPTASLPVLKTGIPIVPSNLNMLPPLLNVLSNVLNIPPTQLLNVASNLLLDVVKQPIQSQTPFPNLNIGLNTNVLGELNLGGKQPNPAPVNNPAPTVLEVMASSTAAAEKIVDILSTITAPKEPAPAPVPQPEQVPAGKDTSTVLAPATKTNSTETNSNNTVQVPQVNPTTAPVPTTILGRDANKTDQTSNGNSTGEAPQENPVPAQKDHNTDQAPPQENPTPDSQELKSSLVEEIEASPSQQLAEKLQAVENLNTDATSLLGNLLATNPQASATLTLLLERTSASPLPTAAELQESSATQIFDSLLRASISYFLNNSGAQSTVIQPTVRPLMTNGVNGPAVQINASLEVNLNTSLPAYLQCSSRPTSLLTFKTKQVYSSQYSVKNCGITVSSIANSDICVKQGTTLAFTWQATGFSDTVTLSLINQQSQYVYTLASNLPVQSQNFTWSVPMNLPSQLISTSSVSNPLAVRITRNSGASNINGTNTTLAVSLVNATQATSFYLRQCSVSLVNAETSAPYPSSEIPTIPFGGDIGVEWNVGNGFSNQTVSVSVRESNSTTSTIVNPSAPITPDTFIWNVPATGELGPNNSLTNGSSYLFEVKINTPSDSTNTFETPIFVVYQPPTPPPVVQSEQPPAGIEISGSSGLYYPPQETDTGDNAANPGQGIEISGSSGLYYPSPQATDTGDNAANPGQGIEISGSSGLYYPPSQVTDSGDNAANPGQGIEISGSSGLYYPPQATDTGDNAANPGQGIEISGSSGLYYPSPQATDTGDNAANPGQGIEISGSSGLYYPPGATTTQGTATTAGTATTTIAGDSPTTIGQGTDTGDNDGLPGHETPPPAETATTTAGIATTTIAGDSPTTIGQGTDTGDNDGLPGHGTTNTGGVATTINGGATTTAGQGTGDNDGLPGKTSTNGAATITATTTIGTATVVPTSQTTSATTSGTGSGTPNGWTPTESDTNNTPTTSREITSTIIPSVRYADDGEPVYCKNNDMYALKWYAVTDLANMKGPIYVYVNLVKASDHSQVVQRDLTNGFQILTSSSSSVVMNIPQVIDGLYQLQVIFLSQQGNVQGYSTPFYIDKCIMTAQIVNPSEVTTPGKVIEIKVDTPPGVNYISTTLTNPEGDVTHVITTNTPVSTGNNTIRYVIPPTNTSYYRVNVTEDQIQTGVGNHTTTRISTTSNGFVVVNGTCSCTGTTTTPSSATTGGKSTTGKSTSSGKSTTGKSTAATTGKKDSTTGRRSDTTGGRRSGIRIDIDIDNNNHQSQDQHQDQNQNQNSGSGSNSGSNSGSDSDSESHSGSSGSTGTVTTTVYRGSSSSGGSGSSGSRSSNSGTSGSRSDSSKSDSSKSDSSKSDSDSHSGSSGSGSRSDSHSGSSGSRSDSHSGSSGSRSDSSKSDSSKSDSKSDSSKSDSDSHSGSSGSGSRSDSHSGSSGSRSDSHSGSGSSGSRSGSGSRGSSGSRSSTGRSCNCPAGCTCICPDGKGSDDSGASSSVPHWLFSLTAILLAVLFF